MSDATAENGLNWVTRDGAAFLVAGPWLAGFDPEWFNPGWWQGAAKPVSSGGRGHAWFLDAGEQPMVLRHYSRGGLVAHIATDAYLYTGLARTRSVAECHLLQTLSQRGLPVPRPIACAVWRTGLLHYRAAILVERLTGTRALGDQAATLSDAGWRAVGATIRRFHDEGVHHADLNCFNILLGENSTYLIDFDRGSLRSCPARPGEGWTGRNLARLYRSLTRLEWPDATRLDAAWQALRAGYDVESGQPANG